ncbi:MAG: MFS transporter [Chloroflexi bacterium]|nr:MFS transporter [Chloroflexota bacterium]
MSAHLQTHIQTDDDGRMRRSIYACVAGTLVLRIASGAMGLLVGFYLRYLSRNNTEISASIVGLFAASYFFTELVASPLLGTISDRIGRKPFIVIGPLLGAVAVQLTAVTALIPLLLVTRLLEGLSSASSIPPTLSYLSAITARSESMRGKVMSWFEIATIVGLALGSVVGGRLWDAFGPAGFSSVAIIYILSALIFWFGMHRIGTAPPGQSQRFEQILQLLKDPFLLRFAPAWLAMNAVLGLWINHLSFQMSGPSRRAASQLLMTGFSGTTIGIIFAGMAIAFSIGILGWSFFLNRFKKVSIMLWSISGLFLIVLASLILNHQDMSNVLGIRLVLIPVIMGLLIQSGFTPAALAYLADLSERHVTSRGTIMGFYTVLLGVGQLLGSWLGGPFADWGGVDGIIILTGLLGLCAAGAVLILREYIVSVKLPTQFTPSEASSPHS